jgi:hypothetical protein
MEGSAGSQQTSTVKTGNEMNWFKLESWHLEFATHSGCLPFEAFRSLGFPSAFVQPRFIRGFPLLGQIQLD